jgi:hypothetical protein
MTRSCILSLFLLGLLSGQPLVAQTAQSPLPNSELKVPALPRPATIQPSLDHKRCALSYFWMSSPILANVFSISN